MLGYFKKDSESLSILSSMTLTDLFLSRIEVSNWLLNDNHPLMIDVNSSLLVDIHTAIHRKIGCIGCDICMHKYITELPMCD